MACKKHREDMILYLYGELDARRKTSLEEHMKKCRDCAREFAYTRQVFSSLDETKPEEIPEGNWQKTWAEIKDGMRPPQTRPWDFSRVPKWSVAAAGILIVFMLGIFAGRLWFFPSFKGQGENTRTHTTIIAALTEHLDELKPYLVEAANFNEEEKDSTTITVDKNLLKYLMIQNVLFRKALSEKDASTAQFLEDIELVLKELINMEKGDDRTPALVKELIDKREILFNMEVLHTKMDIFQEL